MNAFLPVQAAQRESTGLVGLDSALLQALPGLETKSRTQSLAANPAGTHLLGRIFQPQQNDFSAGDYPMVRGQPTMPKSWADNPVLSNAVRYYSGQSSAELVRVFNREFQLAAHHDPIAQQLLVHFVGGSGQRFVSPPGSAWSREIAADSEGKRIAETMAARLQGAAEAQYKATGRVDVNGLSMPVTVSDRAVWGDKPWSAAFGAFGSTDGLQVDLVNGRFDPSTRQLTGTLRIHIIDTFGLSNSDYDSPGQIAMWILQHQRGVKPFINEVVYDTPLNFKVRDAREPGQGGGAGSRPMSLF